MRIHIYTHTHKKHIYIYIYSYIHMHLPHSMSMNRLISARSTTWHYKRKRLYIYIFIYMQISTTTTTLPINNDNIQHWWKESHIVFVYIYTNVMYPHCEDVSHKNIQYMWGRELWGNLITYHTLFSPPMETVAECTIPSAEDDSLSFQICIYVCT